ncbi:heparanase-like protein 2 [Tripterygium wilfordii]|uniref:heparanase-like protein 2 n=1 Tax=Tripterygium wilfordii TaxID=458696 RepID=UPI0018F81C02|nr:heparanase-like protein 2 [Tripterygium wilfordii]
MGMMRVIVCCVLLSLFAQVINIVNAENVEVRVKSVKPIAKTDDNFVCATLDWWPSTKCDYGQCPWQQAGLLNLDLENKILQNAIKAFKSLRLRVGGSLEDQVLYNVGNTFKRCPKFKRYNGGLFGFTHGCLSMDRWDQLNQLFKQTGAIITFGLNVLYGKQKDKNDKTLWIGEWNAKNSRDLMNYTISRGYKIDSYELGNELCGGGIAARLTAEQYGKDMIKLKKIVQELYPNPSTQPKLVGPAGFYDEKWFKTFLQVTGPNVVDGVSHHIYNLGAGVDKNLIHRIQDPFFLSRVAKTYSEVSKIIEEFGPWSGAWVGEAGGAYNSGGKDVSHTFANGFWYLDQLGMTSTLNHKVYCRQTLIGGNYGLLNTTTFIPNPDYYGALLWHRLMGSNVLSVNHNGSPYLRVYSHCSRNKPGVTLLIINMSNSTFSSVSAVNDMNLYTSSSMEVSNNGGAKVLREEYHLTAKDGNIQSDVVLLNGTPLRLTNSDDIPELKPKFVDPTSPILVAPQSFVFATLRDFNAPACLACDRPPLKNGVPCLFSGSFLRLFSWGIGHSRNSSKGKKKRKKRKKGKWPIFKSSPGALEDSGTGPFSFNPSMSSSYTGSTSFHELTHSSLINFL